MFNNLCLPERAAEPVQLALIESRAESKLKHILTAQLLALKERALGKRSAAPRTNKQPRMCTTRSGVGGRGGCLRILSHAKKHTPARTDISLGRLPERGLSGGAEGFLF